MLDTVESILPFPEASYDAPLAVVQEALAADGLAGALLFDPENIFWLTGFQTIGYFTLQCLWVPRAGAPVLISRMVNQRLAEATPTIGSFAGISDTAEPVAIIADVLTAATDDKAIIGLETAAWYLTVDTYLALQDRVGRAFRPWNGTIEEQRKRKSVDQLDRIRQAARAAEAGMAAALTAISPGRTENDIAAAMHQATIAAGSEYLGHPPLVVAGERSALCFAMWRRRPLKRGDIVLLENAGCVDRYHAMLSRTAVIGPPTAEQKRAADTSIGMLDAAIDAIRPGVTSDTVDAACHRVAEAAGLARYSFNRTAYAIGIGFPPNWAEGRFLSLRAGDATVLEPGMVFHIVGGALFLEDYGVLFSDSILVTEDGCEPITTHPRKLVVIDD
ncbi:MAG: aminopeptidase P family protein [Alphaproteobacteria bacterium]|nr:aminopeptidase P family protein [Alphaproteobacteria bacterium]